MPELALALWGLALVLVGGLRIYLHHRATGSTGILLPDDPPFSVPWWGAILFQGSLALMAAGAGLDATGGPGPVEALDSGGVRIAGAIVAVIGIVGVFGAQAAMGREWRIGVSPDQGTKLVSGGPFRLVRNPIYTAMFAGFAGIVATDPTPIALAGYAMLVIGIEIQVRRVEEPFLLAAHGDSFRAYATRVGRFLPGIGTTRGVDPDFDI